MKRGDTLTIFLDIDGVISTVAGTTLDPSRNFDARCIEYLSHLIDVLDDYGIGCRVVVSSDWRKRIKLGELAMALVDEGGASIASALVGATPSLDARTMDLRGYEITNWMESNGVSDLGTILILDDNLIIHPQLRERWVRTDHYEGFTYRHYKRAMDLLANGNMNRSDFIFGSQSGAMQRDHERWRNLGCPIDQDMHTALALRHESALGTAFGEQMDITMAWSRTQHAAHQGTLTSA